MSRKRRAESQSEDDDNDFSEDSLSSDSNASSEDDSSSDEEELVHCDFEFFDPQEQDFLGIRHLLRQLFDCDADLFDLGALAEMILAQPLVGSTVKTEGQQGDPLSFLTLLNFRDKPVIKQLLKYLLEKSKSNPSFQKELSNVLDGNGDVALVLSERIINMPTDVAAPSYKMLLEEIQWANEDNEPYEFSHFLIMSRTYIQEESGSGAEDEAEVIVKPRSKKLKRRNSVVDNKVRYFHPEDELFSRTAADLSFPFTTQSAADESNLKTSGLLLLIGKSEFEAAIGEIERFLGVNAQ